MRQLAHAPDKDARGCDRLPSFCREWRSYCREAIICATTFASTRSLQSLPFILIRRNLPRDRDGSLQFPALRLHGDGIVSSMQRCWSRGIATVKTNCVLPLIGVLLSLPLASCNRIATKADAATVEVVPVRAVQAIAADVPDTRCRTC